MNILIAVPTFENISPETFKGIYDLRTEGHQTSFETVKGYDCAKARNTIADKALEGGYDYVLMIDSDVIVPPDTIELCMTDPVDICFGFCPRKNAKDKRSAVFKYGPAYGACYTYDELNQMDPGRVEIRGAGAACAMIRTDVFEHLKYPYFKYVSYANKTFLSEDLYFCSRAREKGYQLWADTRIRCGHMTRGFQYE